jgi:hypothetical protein
MDQIANGFETMQRWLFRPGYDATQRAVIGDIEGRLLISQATSDLAGYQQHRTRGFYDA